MRPRPMHNWFFKSIFKMGFKNGSGPKSDEKHWFQKSNFGPFLKVYFQKLNVIGLELSFYIYLIKTKTFSKLVSNLF